MYIYLRSIFLIIVLFIFFNCDDMTYEPQEENVFKIQEPNYSDVKIDLSNTTDTLGIWGEATLHYNIDIGKKRFSHIEIYIDNNIVVTTSNPSEAKFNTSYLNDGIHALRFEVYVHANNGSLADKLDLEMAKIYQNIPVIIDNAPPEAITNLEFHNINGTLKISWPAYKRFNFQEYQVYSHGFKAKTISYPGENYFFDPGFVGRPEEYSVKIKAANQTLEGPSVVYSDSTYFNSIKLDEQGRVVFEWEKFHYYNNFKCYQIIKGENEIIAEFTSIDTTSYIGEVLPFGSKVDYHIDVYRTNYSWTIYRTNNLSIYSGLKISPYRIEPYYDPSTDSYILYYADKIVRYSSDFNTVLAETEPDYYHHSDYDFIDFRNGKLYQSNINAFSELDPFNFTTIRRVEIADMWQDYPLAAIDFKIVPDNKIVFEGCLYLTGLYSDKNYLIDLDTEQILDIEYWPGNWVYKYLNGETIIDSTNAYEIREVSEDGNYVILQNPETIVFDISENFFKKVYSPSRNQVCFYNEEDCFIETEQGKIILRNNSDGSILREISADISLLNNPLVDPVTNYLGGVDVDSGDFIIFNLESGQILIRIPVLYTGIWFANMLRLVNNNIFSAEGYYLPINF